MNKIAILSPIEAQKIAAGEVVERPTSVVKELVENALDAKSTSLTITIEEGGKRLIKITDNGCGMSEADAELSILNHATSKISSVDDLTTLTTFGFRGEALASISSVSKFILTTRAQTASHGITLEIENGIIKHRRPAACNEGTEIAVGELFYNVPARQKFLKKRETEWRCIEQLIDAIALSHQNVSITLTHDGRTALHAPAVETQKDRLLQVWGPAFADYLISGEQVDQARNYIVQCTIAKPGKTRYDRNSIYLFVNNRWVKNHRLIQAFIRGYDNILPPQQYPMGSCFIMLDPSAVDINIHPRKEEVQFLHPHVVESLVESAVRNALQRAFIRPTATSAFIPAAAANAYESPSYDEYPHPFSFAQNRPAAAPIPSSVYVPASTDQVHEQSPSSAFVPELPEAVPSTDVEFQIIGQVLSTYIIVETAEGMTIIDQHAAHERILYELFSEQFTDESSTQLLFPQIVQLSTRDMQIIEPQLPLLHAEGIMAERYGENELIIKAVPVHAKQCSFDEIIRAFIGWNDEQPQAARSTLFHLLTEKLRALMACKAAVKAGDQLSKAEMENLVSRLLQTNHRTTCPHGRPTSWTITKNELERQFQR